MLTARRALVGLALLVLTAAALAPLWVERIEQPGDPGSRLQAVSEAFVRYREETGKWPCDWSGRSSFAARLSSFDCVAGQGPGGEVVDRWGNVLRVVYQAPTPKLPGASRGAIALVSPGRNGELETRDSSAVRGEAAGDDQIWIVTREVR
jgi:hypothetical protein